MARMSIHERGLAVGRLQAGQSVSQCLKFLELLFNIFIIIFFCEGPFFQTWAQHLKNVDFKSLMNLSVTICLIFSGSACVWLSQIHHCQAVAFIRNYVNSMRQRCEHVVRANGGHIRYYVVMTDVFLLLSANIWYCNKTVKWYFTLLKAKNGAFLQFFILHLRLYSFVCYFFKSADFNKM